MRMRSARVVIVLVGALAVAGLGFPAASLAAPGVQGSSADQTAWIEQTIASMTLPERIGQLFVPRIYGTTANTTDPAAVSQNLSEMGVANAVELVQQYHVGGLIYFGANVTTPRALAEFGNTVQHAAASMRVPVPVMTSMDQEEGSVLRMGPPATVFPGSMALGASRSPRDAWVAAHITGTELRAMGVFQDMAPDADVNMNPANPVIGVRSFGSRPALVSSMVAAQVDGYQASNIASTAKHFPGHGDTAVDSHTGLPVITHTRTQLEAIDFPPFRAAIAAGVDSIMTAHILVPSLDPSGDPATLSAPILTGVLRGEMGYDGVIVTDSLRMQGVRTKYGDGPVAVRAIQAGVDQLLDPPNLPVAFSAVSTAVANGQISEARINESVRRILAMKWNADMVNPGAAFVNGDLVDAVVGAPAHLATAQRITDQTTTLIRNIGGRLPTGPVTQKRILVTGRGVTTTGAVTQALRSRGAVVQVLETGLSPTADATQDVLAAAAGQDLVIAVTYNVTSNPQQATFINTLIAAKLPVIAVAAGTPYDIASFPAVPSYLAAYSFRPVAMESAVRVITGQIAPQGLLPVTILRADNPARALYPFGFGL